ncbi:MAG: peptide chain release factor N(5)-glutamine methyltransferase [Candidatus Cloacimonadales bacterium]|jgi:release factor glutamine methyltransferase|nr:peptide chain release factor N(5)-glutamine methyltransferase [Candidatus Cloacimonadales bacterium]
MSIVNQKTISAVLCNAECFLKESQVPDAKVDAELILAHFLHCKRTELYLAKDEEIADDCLKKIESALQKRSIRYPLQYIFQEIDFLNSKLYVDENTLIARPETEYLCDLIIKENMGKALDILDIGTGSGAIAISLKKGLRNSCVDAVDISDNALGIAVNNAVSNSVIVNFFASDLFENINKKYDLIVSNPPYIAESDYESLEAEIFFEPKIALVADQDGLQCIFKILESAPNYMKKDACLYIEFGYQQAELIVEFAKKYKYKSIKIIKDLSGFDRFIKLEV